ncbi:cardiolipin synthase B [Undibacterium sp. YM2]|uniref:cardiolipin synthase n=1 Tax=Undibacterium sp. YM2 TaxID=2058625 RepID=UPI001331E129|nr:cardiolipin synthase [Undibacterium sp. YM2]BBB65009.1 cardiolipin synthase B [Undibacterium sp. YM2]
MAAHQRLPSHLLMSSVSIAILVVLNGCSSLPEVNYLEPALDQPQKTTSAKPTINNGNGELSTSKAQALMKQRWKNSGAGLANMQALAALEEAVTGSPLIAGNQVTLLFDGPQTMNAMMTAIRQAKDHIHLETYIFDQDELGLEFARLLIEKQQAGVEVNIIYDSVGTIGTPQIFFDNMKAAGIHLLEFNPVNPTKLQGPWLPNRRDHRKILIVDGEVAFTGGVNISASYANSSLFRSKSKNPDKIGWRDTHIQITGPAVAALQWIFLETWINVGDKPPADRLYFPALKNQGNKMVRVLASEPESNPAIYKAYLLAIQEARDSIHITSAYFVPDAQILKALIAAAKRGVDVKIIMPGVTDSGLVFHAGQSFYDEMLAGGIKVYQLNTSVLHAKTAVIDQVWSTVGSTNIDTRSFLHNKEVNVVVIDTEFAIAMENAFKEDLRLSTEVTLETWQQRPAMIKLKEWLARRLEYWL